MKLQADFSEVNIAQLCYLQESTWYLQCLCVLSARHSSSGKSRIMVCTVV